MISRKTRTLSNGLRLVAVEMPHLHSAEIAVYIKVGGRNDPPGKEGLSHFLEHMLFRGTAEHPTAMELETAFEAIGGSVNASTDEESTCYFSRVHPDHVGTGIHLFSSMLLRPRLAGIDIEKRIITEEALEDINERGDEVNTHNLASKLLWPDHPLGAPTIGYLETIAGFCEDDLQTHLARYYVPLNTVIVIAGEVKADNIFTACENSFGAWSGTAAPPAIHPTALQTTPQSLFVDDSDSQIHLQVAFRGLARYDRGLMAARLIRRTLCGGGSSRLHLSLRERLGIVYSVDANISAYEETGSFGIELSTAPENLAEAVTEVLAETGRLAWQEIASDELQRVRQGYLFDLEYSRDSTYEMQVRYGWGELMGIVRSIEEDRKEADSVGTAELRATSLHLFRPENLNLVAVGPCSSKTKAKVAEIIERYRENFESKDKS